MVNAIKKKKKNNFGVKFSIMADSFQMNLFKIFNEIIDWHASCQAHCHSLSRDLINFLITSSPAPTTSHTTTPTDPLTPPPCPPCPSDRTLRLRHQSLNPVSCGLEPHLKGQFTPYSPRPVVLLIIRRLRQEIAAVETSAFSLTWRNWMMPHLWCSR